MENEVRYAYSINPKKVIKFLSRKSVVPPIRVSKTLLLTKEEALECLRYGSVYRRFANTNVRVNTLNIHRLHQDHLMSEEEYQKFVSAQMGNDRGTISNTTVTLPTEPISEETKVDMEVVEENTEVETVMDHTIKEERETSLKYLFEQPLVSTPDESNQATDKLNMPDLSITETPVTESIDEVQDESVPDAVEEDKKETESKYYKKHGKSNKYKR